MAEPPRGRGRDLLRAGTWLVTAGVRSGTANERNLLTGDEQMLPAPRPT
jgi:hypothetical protein